MGWFDTQKPPTVPTDFEKVPMMKSTWSITPWASATPRPCSPMKPMEWASSTSTMAPYCLGQRHHLVERGDVAEHRIDALEDHQLAGFRRQPPQPLFKRVEVIVTERHDLGIAERAAVVDRCMAVDVEDDVILFARDRRNDAEVRLVSGRKDHGMVHGVEVASAASHSL